MLKLRGDCHSYSHSAESLEKSLCRERPWFDIKQDYTDLNTHHKIHHPSEPPFINQLYEGRPCLVAYAYRILCEKKFSQISPADRNLLIDEDTIAHMVACGLDLNLTIQHSWRYKKLSLNLCARPGLIGESVLHVVARVGRVYLPAFRLLLKYGADPNLRDCEGMTPLERVRSEHGDKIYQDFAAEVANQPYTQIHTILMFIAEGAAHVVKSMLFMANTQIQIFSHVNMTSALIEAARCQKPDYWSCLLLLLKSGRMKNALQKPFVDYQAEKYGGKTALHYLAERGDVIGYLLLYYYGANHTIRDKGDQTPEDYLQQRSLMTQAYQQVRWLGSWFNSVCAPSEPLALLSLTRQQLSTYLRPWLEWIEGNSLDDPPPADWSLLKQYHGGIMPQCPVNTKADKQA